MANKSNPMQVAEDAIRRAREIHDEWMQFLGMVDFNSLLELPGATKEDTMRLLDLRTSLQNRRTISPDEFVRLVTNVAAQTQAVSGAKMPPPATHPSAQRDVVSLLRSPRRPRRPLTNDRAKL